MDRHFWSSLWLLGFLCFLIAAMGARHCGAETLPYRARVIAAEAALYSGPGDSSYVTETLPQGQTVEVYQERPDGWCAVRPPEGSFSWVFARHVRLLAGGLGEVNKDDVASRVGSRLDSQRDAVQVRLAEGEIVQILGTAEDGGDTWYKISPPSGEFRWVQKSSLVAEGTVDRPGPETAPPTTNRQSASDVWHPVSQTSLQPAGTTTNERGVIAASHDEAADAAPTGAAPDSASPATAPPAENQSSDEFARQIADIDLRLSQMVAQPTAAWQIDQLQKEAEQLLSQANDVAQREAIKGELAKIDRFAGIQRRYQWASAAQGTTSQQQPAPNGAAVTSPGQEAGFDAVGVLRPVVSRRPGAPQYALVNEQGQVVSFVTPAPDVNLEAYLGRRVGILGGRGYMPEFQRAHVTASRVAPLGERIIR